MVTTTVVGIIQARMSSQRLPGKILAPVAEATPLLAVLERRLRGSTASWWLATTNLATDDVTAAWGHDLGFKVYRGDENDVLSRFTDIIRDVQPDLVVRATADNPFIDAEIVGSLVDTLQEADNRFRTVRGTTTPRQFPLGYAPEVVRAEALLQLDERLKGQRSVHRTHVTSAISQDSVLRFADPSSPCRPEWRWTVDTPDDLHMAREAFRLLGSNWPDARYADIVEVLDQHPEVHRLNVHVEQKRVEDG